MSFRVGQTVVHPHHGTATIDEFEERELNGETARYIVLNAPATDLTVKVPVDACDDIGIRNVIDEEEMEDVLDVLRSEAKVVKGHWARRLKRNQRRLRSGDPCEVAEVLRDLANKKAVKGLSPAEKRLHDKARTMICGELAAVVGSADKSEKLVDDVLDAKELIEA